MFLMKVIQKIRFALVIENEIFYINGSETLPPPLTREEEQHIMENIAKGDSKAREPLIVHNLRLVVYIAGFDFNRHNRAYQGGEHLFSRKEY